MNDRILCSERGQVAHVQLNRPEKRNGLDLALFDVLLHVAHDLRGRKDLRAVVISGAGKAFCAGLDFADFMSSPTNGQKLLARESERVGNLVQQSGLIWQDLPMPVIAAIHGVAFGGGLQIALGADLRYATPDAQLSVMEIKWGLIPDMSITQTLPQLVGIDIAKELTFTGRIIDGNEALRIGLITALHADPVQAALQTAVLIATKSPHAIRAAKKMWNEAPKMARERALLLETELQLELLGSPNQMEAVQANFQKREPKFQDV